MTRPAVVLAAGLAATLIAVVMTTAVPVAAAPLPHLKLKRSFPAKDTVLTSSPDAVRLWLTEKADLPATRITVTGAGNAAVATAKTTRGAAADAPIEATLTQPVGAGRYTVAWKTMSKDGHVVSGTFGFTVKPAP
ncbi:MAG: copper resistance protein CopC [Gemmatimonas sp.]|uniref:copper resistance CopC family protein n=1 Tax=Gemmatimonas sp. TaxID=1962908 RepID=UPI00391F2BA3